MLHPLEEIVLDVIGALADLKQGRLLAREDFASESAGADRPDTACAGVQNAQRQEGQQGKDVFLVEQRPAIEGIIFVAPERRARVVVHIVANETDLALQLQRADGLLHEQIAGAVVTHDIEGAGAFGRAVFQVAHVDINPPPVEEKAAVPRRFVPVPIMEVDEAVAIVFEQPVADAGEHLLDGDGGLGQTAVFGFKTCDPVRHGGPRLNR